MDAAKLRAAICRRNRGWRPVLRSWDAVCLLRLADPELLSLHAVLLRAHRRGEELASVPIPPDVAHHQARLMMQVILAGPQAVRTGRAVEPRQGEVEAKLERMVGAAEKARRAADRWLAERVRRR